MNTCKKDIIREIALLNNINRSIVEELVDYQFKFVARVMAKGEYESVRLHYLGLFGVTPGRVDKMMKIWNEARLREEQRANGIHTIKNENGPVLEPGSEREDKGSKEGNNNSAFFRYSDDKTCRGDLQQQRPGTEEQMCNNPGERRSDSDLS